MTMIAKLEPEPKICVAYYMLGDLILTLHCDIDEGDVREIVRSAVADGNDLELRAHGSRSEIVCVKRWKHADMQKCDLTLQTKDVLMTAKLNVKRTELKFVYDGTDLKLEA